MKKIALIGQFPPPLHGLSKALDTLYHSKNNRDFVFIKYDITKNKLFIIQLFNLLISNNDIYYITIAQSVFGNIRDLMILILILFKKKKIVIHLHGGGFYNTYKEMNIIQKKINKLVISKVDCGIVLGESLKYIFEEFLDENKIKIVKNCVDEQYTLQEDIVENKFIKLTKKKNIRILYLSNFIKDKGYLDVLELARYTKDIDDRFEFDFAGKFFSDTDEKEFFEFINSNHLEKTVKYHGIVEGEKKLRLLESCDYFILLTRYKNEGQPISIIEAAMNGLSIITTEHAGIGDILPYSEMITIDKDNIDIDQIYIELKKELLNRDKMINKIRRNRYYVTKEFSEEHYICNILDIFDEVIR